MTSTGDKRNKNPKCHQPTQCDQSQSDGVVVVELLKNFW